MGELTQASEPSALNERQEAVLRAVVSHYVRTGEPAGSKTLVERYKLHASPATVRNEMAVLEESGYLSHPHTSAGRIPTDRGYRYFVDAWGNDVKLPAAEARRVHAFYVEPRFAVEDALRETALLLSNLTHHAAVVFAPALAKAMVRHIDVVRLSGPRAMLVLVADTGRVENRILGVSPRVSDDDLSRVAEALNRLLVGSSVEEAASRLAAHLGDVPSDVREVAAAAASALSQRRDEDLDQRVFLEGTSKMVDEAKFSDIETVRQVVGALEHRRVLLEVLADALTDTEVSVRIGSENPIAEMQHCAVVAAPYGDEELKGSLGIVGPTRMDYRRTIAAVHEVASNLGAMLRHLGL